MDVSISKNNMRNLLLLCTKNVHICFGGDIYQQNDGVAMSSPLGPVLAGMFMLELETRIIPRIMDNICIYKERLSRTTCFSMFEFFL